MCAVLSGTKYGLKQTRGKFGLGAKMVGSVLYTDEITLLILCTAVANSLALVKYCNYYVLHTKLFLHISFRA